MIFGNETKARTISKRLVSVLLVMALTVTMTYTGTTSLNVLASSSVSILDIISISIDGNSKINMSLYTNGLFEASVNVSSGVHNYIVYSNDTALCEGISFNAAENGNVFIRYDSSTNTITDSINNSDTFCLSATLTGNFSNIPSLNIGSWDPTDTDGDLDYVGGGIFAKTFTFDEALNEDITLENDGYKVTFNHSYDYSLPSANKPLTIPAGTTSLTVYTDSVNGTLYDSINSEALSIYQNTGNITSPAFATTVSLIGSVRQNADSNWDVTSLGYDFTQISDNLYIYQAIYNTGSYEYKACYNHNYWYESYGGGNTSLNITSDNTLVTFVYNLTDDKLYDSINHEDVLSQLFGFTVAPLTSDIISNQNGSYTFTMPYDEGSTLKLVYYIDNISEPCTVDMTEVSSSNGEFSGGYTATVSFGDAASSIYYYYDIDGNKTNDTINPTSSVNGISYNVLSKPAYSGRLVNVPGTFPGNSWDAASNTMTYLGNGLYSYTFSNVPAATYEYKIAMGSWDENYGVAGVRDGSNYSVSVYETSDVTVFYNDVSHNSVTSLTYVFADINLTSSSHGISTKLTDSSLSSIYQATVSLNAGSYNDFVITYNNQTFEVNDFTLTNAKDVTFYFDPSTLLYYNNASDVDIDAANIYYNSKDTAYKMPFGAASAGDDITFSIDTGDDIISATLFIKGPEAGTYQMNASDTDNGKRYSTTINLNEYGMYTYYFALSNGSNIKVYSDDDGYYGEGTLSDLTDIKPYDLTIYKAGFKTPDWMKDAVIYQIFPDRFMDGDSSNNQIITDSRGDTDYEYIKDWYTLPENPEQEELNSDTYPLTAYRGDGNWSNEIYGGDIKGITQRVDYLKALGVNVIYLNPIVKSISSHRYDASDYSSIDPILGTMGDFEELVQVATANDMHIILDGVFNHVADDSIYFDRYYKYVGVNGTVGAYPFYAYVYDYMNNTGVSLEEAKFEATKHFSELGVTDFSYTEWFDIYNEYMTDTVDTIGDRASLPVYSYDCWWGYDSMPVIKSTNGSEYQTDGYAEAVIEGPDSISSFWLEKGSSGWRLDVANEVSDETWQHFRDSVKSLSSDNVIIGEIWDEATKYLLGDMYDSVMNYVFRNAVLSYVRGDSTATDCMNSLEKIRELYPEEAYYSMMNLVGSHDTTRLLSYLDGISDDRNDKDIASAFPSYETTSDRAKRLQYIVAFIQMTYAGAPTIYYGDELGMTGADDPDNRRAMIWGMGNEELVKWYSSLASIRANYEVLRTGDIISVDSGNDNVLAYIRRDENNEILIAVNTSDSDITISVDSSLLTNSTLTNVLNTANSLSLNSRALTEITVPAYSGLIMADEVKTISIDQTALSYGYDNSHIFTRSASSNDSNNKTDSNDKALNNATASTSSASDAKTGDNTDVVVILTSSLIVIACYIIKKRRLIA